MTSVSKAAWRLGLFAAAMVGVLLLVVMAIKRPVAGATEAHYALFTDANGLKTGDDVRMYGVQVGKVEEIELDGTVAKVRFTVRTDSPVYENSTLAIRYQNLTGQRYVDVQQQPNPTARVAAESTIGLAHTIPSFDVTTLYNGLKPVLATLSPEALNRFSQNMIAVIEGNGTGIGPALDSIGELSTYVTDRQQVITTLVRNMSEIADRIGGKSPQLVTLLTKIADVFAALQIKVNGLIDFALTAPPVLEPVDSLLATLGLTTPDNPDADALIRAVFPNPQDAVDALSRLPGLLSALAAALPATGASPIAVCSKGAAEVPGPLGVLIAGQKVSICNG
ncbi:MCE family protein [Nocardia huaxiensis]|uniref:MCE family protein n=1 Tax=Nocardia huaxiensis TaxID=2755382 RepID=A0A7D6V8M9_9NOCA|nr:MCE family protein [Nocardia huaxiensis]QLY30452.1 MCE family protein [Nocardia huaxiensis]UFS95949.1 MCE family protein [Nocardia huaxiensis]